LFGTFTGVKYIVSLTETINQNKSAIKIKKMENDFKSFLIMRSTLTGDK